MFVLAYMFPGWKCPDGRKIRSIAEIKHAVVSKHAALKNAPDPFSQKYLISSGLIVDNTLCSFSHSSMRLRAAAHFAGKCSVAPLTSRGTPASAGRAGAS